MNKVFSQFGISTACIFITTFSASALDLQPSLTAKPLECKMSEGHFILDKTVAIFAGEFKTEAEYLRLTEYIT